MSSVQSSSLSDRLLRYSAAASLVGSGILLAGGQNALATGGISVTSPNTHLGPGQSLAINFDSDTGNATAEFVISVTTSSTGYLGGIWVNNFQQGVHFLGAVATSNPNWVFPIPLDLYDTIGSSGLWNNAGQCLTSGSNYGFTRGNWNTLIGIHYLGVKFTGDDSQTHYGWVELDTTDSTPDALVGPNEVIVKRYGYDTTADQAILAGSTTPASVDLTSASATGGLQTIAVGAFATLGGILTWLQRKLLCV